jgi:hypothetical protein
MEAETSSACARFRRASPFALPHDPRWPPPPELRRCCSEPTPAGDGQMTWPSGVVIPHPRFGGRAVLVMVQDNLSTHKPASLYEAFPAAEARRLIERFEWHYTPKHGSWLDMAEAELSVLSSQCLDRRIPNKQALIEDVAAWEKDRNKNHTKANWQFTTADARIKLKRLYPAM